MASYLLRNRNGNYYTRVPFPLELKQLGFPHELRISLLTKDRAIASFRNLMAAHSIKSLIEGFRVNEELLNKIRVKREEIRAYDKMEPHLEALRKEMREMQLERNLAVKKAKNLQMALDESVQRTEAIKTKAKEIVKTAHEKSLLTLSEVSNERKLVETLKDQISGIKEKVTLAELQQSFIHIKESECERKGIKSRTLQQLKTRTNSFVDFAGKDRFAHDIGLKDTNAYINCISPKLSTKTLNDYRAAISQMFTHAQSMEFVSKNPFNHIKIKKSAPKSRPIWQKNQLKCLFSSDVFTSHAYNNIDDYWIPLLLLFTGARPSEICQLRTKDIQILEGVPYVNITDEDGHFSLKTESSRREIPIHSKLIKLGFMKFVEQRFKQGNSQLFSCTPTGKNNEWSKNFEQRFSRLLTGLGFLKGQRPTAYSFRHTFSDELQDLAAIESAVSDLMGHKKNGLTFGHYAKKVRLARLQEVIEKLNFDDEIATVKSHIFE